MQGGIFGWYIPLDPEEGLLGSFPSPLGVCGDLALVFFCWLAAGAYASFGR